MHEEMKIWLSMKNKVNIKRTLTKHLHHDCVSFKNLHSLPRYGIETLLVPTSAKKNREIVIEGQRTTTTYAYC